MTTIILGHNTLDPSTWSKHEDVTDVCAFLAEQFGPKFPDTGRIYHELVDKQHDVTPSSDDDIDKLQGLTGTLYVLIFPGAVPIIVQGAVLIATSIVSWLLSPSPKPPPPRLQQVTGSPNNKLGDRQNTARVLARIPYILGQVRATPDLLAQPYTIYDENNREVEIAYMCVGVGPLSITDIRDGDTLATEIEDMSVGVYNVGNIPTGVDGTSIRDFQIGPFISDPVFTVRKVEAVNGNPLVPQNSFVILGDLPIDNRSSGLSLVSWWDKVRFKADLLVLSPTTGQIYVGSDNAAKVRVGDILKIFFPKDRVTTPDGLQIFPTRTLLDLNQTQVWQAIQNGTGPIPDLSFDVTVTAIDAGWILIPNSVLHVSIPAGAASTEWGRIATYAAGLQSTHTDLVNTIGNGGCIITPVAPDGEGREWVGPFFVDDPIAPPNTRTVVCNFVAQDGLYVDDGTTTKGFDVDIEVEVTAADSLGFPVGSPASQTFTIKGSIASRNTRAVTARISSAEVQGRFLIRARRLTRTPWKQDAPSQFAGTISPSIFIDVPAIATDLYPTSPITGPRLPRNGGGSSPTDTKNSAFLPFKGQSQDAILWTHCYSLTTVTPLSFGQVTTLHVRTVGTEGATNIKNRKISCMAFRIQTVWNGTSFTGTPTTDNKGENCLFTILKDNTIGNLPDSQIDFPGIAAAFAQVRAFFGGATSGGIGGDEAGQFNYTFDKDETTLEETISTICQACFCIPYRQGNIIKVRADLASAASSLLINHRNRVPDSETRNVNFGTEEDFDGVRIDYTEVDINNPTNYAIKTYTIPPLNIAAKPKQLAIPGIRTRKHAAWHAWRAYNRILYQNMTCEVRATEEAAIVAVNDRILIADGTRHTTQDGEIEAVSGTTLTTSQPVNTSGAPSTIFLQHTDGTVETIPIASNPDLHTIVLASPPSVTLVTNPDSGVPTGYVVVRNDSNQSTAFLVAEKECTDSGVYQLTSTNYSHSFYWNDGLYFWLPIISQSGLVVTRDWGPYEFETTVVGGSGATTDVTRGTVYLGTANTQHISITTANVFAADSYTKSCWIFKATATACSILSSPESNNEFFEVAAGADQFRAGHASVVYVSQTGFPVNTWTMATVTYNVVSQVMLLYLNGELIASQTGVPSRPIGNLRIFGQFSGVNGLVGRADDLRYWARVLTPEEIRELYLKTIL
jgi:hypothetical protein